jgi:hypothetical protein
VARPRCRLDLAAGTLAIDVMRVVVDGKVIESDGKTENAQHVLALDSFTLAVLKAHIEMLDQERRDLGPDYNDHGVLFCWPDGRPPHPGHSTRRNRHADLGITGIRLRIFPDYRGPDAGSYRFPASPRGCCRRASCSSA